MHDVPALLYNNPDQTLESLHLEYYEVLPSEAMHDVPALLYNNPDQTLESLHVKYYEILPSEAMHDVSALYYNNPDQTLESLHLQYREILPLEAMHDVIALLYNNPDQTLKSLHLQYYEILPSEAMHDVPALLYNNPDQTLESLHLQYYEILPSESMHDVAGHIDNLLEEIPNHVLKPENKKVNNNLEELKKVIELSMEENKINRCVDYRCGLLKVTHYMEDKFSKENKDMQLLLETLAEIQCILYASEKDRTPEILKYSAIIQSNFSACCYVPICLWQENQSNDHP